MVPIADRTVRVNLIAQASGYISGMDAAARKTREVGSEAQKLAQKADGLRVLGTVGVAVGVAILGMGAAALKTGIAYNTLQQTTRKALSTILGSAEAAADQMDRLDAFARTSPFAKQVFLKAQQQMLAFGIETKKVIPYMDALQNAVAAAGGGGAELSGLVTIMSKIQSSAKITGIDLLQFGNYGINAAELIGESMGKTGAQIRTEITAGTIDATAALDGLVSGMATKFAGAAEGMKSTFAGSTDRMKAAWRDFGSELAKPLVNPNGGGILIDLFNQVADLMRGFIALPEPVKIATSAIVGAVGVVALLGGAALLAVPKIAAFKVAMETLNITASGAKAKIGDFLSLLGNPWVAGITVATLSLVAFGNYLDSTKATTVELTNALLTAKTSADVFGTASKGGGWFTDVGKDLENLSGVLNAAEDQANNLFARFDKTHFGAFDALRDIGVELGKLAGSDLPAAQNAFALLAAETDGSQKQLNRLLEQMPAYKDALIAQANEQHTQIAGLSDAEKATVLLELATGDGMKAANLAAEATKENVTQLRNLSGKAQSAKFDIKGLTETMLAFGSGQLDVNSAERDFQAAIDAATKSIADNGTSLDITTEAGRNNQAALDNIASSSVAAASAIIEQTGSQEDATAAIQAGRDELILQLAQLGITGQAAQDYADKLGLIPANVQTAIDLNTDPATRALNAFINDITSRRPTLYIQGQVIRPGGVAYNYQGGLYERGVKAFAAGGFASGIYNGVQGGIHKFAEKEMGVPWETYISGRSQDRERNIGIWAETGRRLGAMQSAPYRASAPTAVSSGEGSGMSLGGAGSSEWSDAAMQKFGRIVASNVRQDVRQGMI